MNSQKEPLTAGERLILLEHRTASYKRVAILALLLAIIALIFAGWLYFKNQKNSASYRITDEKGHVSAEFGLSTEGRPGLFFYDEQKNTRLWIGIDKESAPKIVLGDEQGRPRASLILDTAHEQQGRLLMLDENGINRLSAGLLDSGKPVIEFSNQQSEKVYQVPPASGVNPEERWINFTSMANHAMQQGKYPEAEKLFKAAMQQTRSFSNSDARRSATMNNLGVLYVQTKNFKQAEKMHQSALALRKKFLGGEAPAVAQSLSNLAMLRRAEGKLERASFLLQEALQILEKKFSTEDVRLLTTLKQTATVLREQKKEKEAELIEKRISKLAEKLKKKNSSSNSKVQSR